MRLNLSELYALCVNTRGTVSVIILFIIMAMITMFGWFLVLFSNRFFFRFSFYKNWKTVITLTGKQLLFTVITRNSILILKT